LLYDKKEKKLRNYPQRGGERREEKKKRIAANKHYTAIIIYERSSVLQLTRGYV
jgi:hypothetical protein